MRKRKWIALLVTLAMVFSMACYTGLGVLAGEPDDETNIPVSGETVSDEADAQGGDDVLTDETDILIDGAGEEMNVPDGELTQEADFGMDDAPIPDEGEDDELIPADEYIPADDGMVPGEEDNRAANAIESDEVEADEEIPEEVESDDALLADEVQYNLWVCGVRVTSTNANDILGDGGKAKYDDSTNTLTFNNPKIATDSASYQSSVIYTSKYELTIQGTADFNVNGPNYCFRGGNCDLTINGDFSFWNQDPYSLSSYQYPIYADNVFITGGDVVIYGVYYGIYADEDVVISGGKATITGLFYAGTHAYYDVTITNAQVESVGGGQGIHSTYGNVTLNGQVKVTDRFDDGTGIEAKYGKIRIDGGSLMSSGSTRAMLAQDTNGEYGGIVIAEGYNIRYPVGGRVSDSGSTIVQADGESDTQYALIDTGTPAVHTVRYLDREEGSIVLDTRQVEHGLPLPDPGEPEYPGHPSYRFDEWERFTGITNGYRNHQNITIDGVPGRTRPVILDDMDIFATWYVRYSLAVFNTETQETGTGGGFKMWYTDHVMTNMSGSMSIGELPSAGQVSTAVEELTIAPDDGYMFTGWMEVPSGEDPATSTNSRILSTEENFQYLPEGDGSTLYALFAYDPRIDLSSCTITGIENKTFTGKALTQKIKVTLDGTTLKSGTDYKVSYANNTKPGKATVTVTGIGQYRGSAKTTFRIYFTDVPPTHNYQKAVYWASDEGIAAGYTGARLGLFGINDDITRGQVVMFLWRAKGKPEPKKNTQTFKDVPTTHNFYKAIQWAAEEGITGGYTGKRAGYFGPNDNCTRGQIATFLWRYAGKPAPKKNTQTFSDVPTKHNFYKAIQWASEQGITAGYSDGSFGINKTCTRGHCVTFTYRMLKN